MPKSKRTIDEYDSGDEIASDNLTSPPKSKKSKNVGGGNPDGKDSEGNPYWELSSGRQPRRVGISEFKKAHLVNIREFYEKDGKMLPGKKGISLTVDQYTALLKAIPSINANLRGLGIDIGNSADGEGFVGESEAEIKPARKVRAKNNKPEKSNIDSTSDEDGE